MKDQYSDVGSLPNMPDPARGSFGCCSVDNKIYMIGGHTGKTHDWGANNYSAQVDCFDISTNQWASASSTGGPFADRPIAAEGFRVASYGQYIYAFGGFMYASPQDGQKNQYTGISSARIDRYDIVQNSWEHVCDLPTPRSDNMIGIIGDTVYLFGGWNANGISGDSKVLTTVDTFNLATEQVLTAPAGFEPPFIAPPATTAKPTGNSNSPTIGVGQTTTSGPGGQNNYDREPVLGGATLSIGGSMYVFGGASKHIRVSTVWKFDPQIGELTRLPDMPKALFDQGVWYDKQSTTAYVLSGYSDGDNLSPNVFALDINSLQWTEKQPLTVPLMFFSVQQVAPNVLGVLGGSMNPALSGPQSASFSTYQL